MPDNTCVCCGKIIPEGRQICPMCGCNDDAQRIRPQKSVRQTNGDRIRQMTDEELVHQFGDSICDIIENCEKNISCYDCKMQWLKQEVQE